MRDEKGFTLIEMTFVLSIAILLNVTMLSFGFKWVQSATEKEAIDGIIAEIYSLQSYSMANQKHTRLRFKTAEGKNYYIAEVPGSEVFVEKELPEGVQLASMSTLKSVEFSGSGDIVQSGVLTIFGSSKRIDITFQFQLGRMIIRESERLLMARIDFNGGNFVHDFWHAFAQSDTYYNAFA